MSFWTAMVIIVAISAITSVMLAKHGVIRTGRGKKDLYVGHRGDDPEVMVLRSEVRQLKDRIAVIERIVTDSDHGRGLALEREIEALRSTEARP